MKAYRITTLFSGRGGEEEEEEGKGVMLYSGKARHTITPLTSYDSWSAHLPTDPCHGLGPTPQGGGVGRRREGGGGGGETGREEGLVNTALQIRVFFRRRAGRLTEAEEEGVCFCCPAAP